MNSMINDTRCNAKNKSTQARINQFIFRQNKQQSVSNNDIDQAKHNQSRDRIK